MANWRYEGLSRAGKRVAGSVEASSEREARGILRSQGIRTKKITPPSILEFDLGDWMIDKGFASAFGQKDLARFTRQLAIMVSSGVPLLATLEILYKSEKNPGLKKAIKNISKEVGEGKTISESMEKQKGFDRLYCNLIKAGEAGGILDTILDKLVIHMDKQEKTKSQIKKALMYPSFVLGVSILVIWGLMVFIVPQFVSMLADTGQDPPAITQFVIDTSEFFSNYTIYLLPGLFISLVLLSSYIKTPVGKIAFDKFMMNMPLFGNVVVKGNLSSFARTLATMLGAGVSLLDSLEIVIDTLDNKIIAADLKNVRAKVVEGKTMTEPLEKIKYFPEMIAQMIRVGEQTGSIDTMLDKCAVVFEEEVSDTIESATKMIEPIMIVFLGGIVAVVLVAMYLPIFMAAGGKDDDGF